MIRAILEDIRKQHDQMDAFQNELENARLNYIKEIADNDPNVCNRLDVTLQKMIDKNFRLAEKLSSYKIIPEDRAFSDEFIMALKVMVKYCEKGRELTLKLKQLKAAKAFEPFSDFGDDFKAN